MNPVTDSALDEKEKLVGLVSSPKMRFYTPAVHSGGGCVGEA